MTAWNATSATPAGAGASATIDEPGYGAWNDNDHNKPSSTYEVSSFSFFFPFFLCQIVD